MLTYLIAFLMALGLSTALIPNIKAVARRYGLFDRNLSSRKIHTAPIPRIGGVAIVVGFYAPLVGLLFHDNEVARRVSENPRHVWGLFAGGLVVFALGLYDDLKGAGAKVKFTVQFAVALAMYFCGFRIDLLSLPFLGHLTLGILALPFTVIWIVGIINAFNLIDGLDGLAGGVAFFAISTVFLVSAANRDVLMAVYMAALGGGVIGFLLFNFNPASIFMGDSGSMFLGFVLAVTSIQTSQKHETAVAILIPIVSLGLPITDTLTAMVRRFVAGRSMFHADRGHLHHRLLALGLTPRRAVILLYGLCIFLAAVSLAMTFGDGQQTALLLVVVALVVSVLIRKLYFGSVGGDSRPLTEVRKRNLLLRQRVRSAGDQLRSARGRDEIWQSIAAIAPDLDVHAIRLELREEVGDRVAHKTSFAWELQGRGGATHELRVPLGTNERGHLIVALRGTSVIDVDRDQEIALEILCDHLAAALERIARGNPPNQPRRIKTPQGPSSSVADS